MGAFFLYPTNSEIDLEAVRTCFREKGLKNPIRRNLGMYTLLLYKKIKINCNNYIERKNYSVYAVGTIIYKGLDYGESLKKVLDDFIFGRLDFNNLMGSYFLLFRIKERIYFCTDFSGIQNVFYSPVMKVLSSSFLAIIYASKNTLHLNKSAITEILTTGSLVGPDTPFIEIKRFLIETPENIEGLEFINQPQKGVPDFCNQSHEDCVAQQLEILEKYFIGIKKFVNIYGINSGLTGGFDSRLLFLLIKKYFSNFQFYSTWRKTKSKSFIIAQKICQTAGLNLKTLPFIYPIDMCEDEVLKTLNQSFWFMDGHVRIYHHWHEEINTRIYRESLLGEKRVSFNGVGGEQYRNIERMVVFKWSLRSWLNNELIYRFSGNCFKSGADRKNFIEYLGTKIKSRLNLNQKTKIDLLTSKRYLNEVFNPANRALRTNAENQISFSLSPFTDFNVSRGAYTVIPHLGASQRFERNMIKALDSKIASIETDYGYSLTETEPLHMRSLSYGKALIPLNIFHKAYRMVKFKKDNFYDNYEKKFPLVKKNTEILKDLNLPINLDLIKVNRLMSPLLISMGFFLYKLSNKVKQ
jgi:hypothetical protein